MAVAGLRAERDALDPATPPRSFDGHPTQCGPSRTPTEGAALDPKKRHRRCNVLHRKRWTVRSIVILLTLRSNPK